ncbi:hypothetical protein PVAND_002402 [Polypedilum vanderplanki]|uniref:Angio-associated migratory cell protein n=1 Tax=Polypedilum vanderplanki TaxID=319348 RepID=A0A9J6BRI7_POLVA|nr:hypothetical protein PVAND_002402 [Polypedilum vanderplanki]
MRNNTPPTSPYQNDDEEEEFIYVGDDIDEVIENLEEIPDNDESGDTSEDDDWEMDHLGRRNRVVAERDDSIMTFSMHTKAIFCGSLNPDGTLAVTGGEDDKAYVWKVDTGEVVFAVTDYTDSVIAAEFSHDGTFLATGDMCGEMKVFRVDKEYKKVWEFSMGDMSWMKWHKKSHVLLAGTEVGDIYIWKIPSGQCKVIGGNGFKSEVAVFTSDEKRLAAGYGDGSFKLWDIKNQQAILTIEPESDNTYDERRDNFPLAITTLDTDNDNQLIITGSENGRVNLINNSGIIGRLSELSPNSGSDAYEGSIEKVLIDCPGLEFKVAITASLNGRILIWDVAHQSIRNEIIDNDDRTGITSLVWGKNQSFIAGTLGGQIKSWNVRNGERKFTLLGHTDHIYDLSYHEGRNIILTVSEDNTAKIFNVPV